MAFVHGVGQGGPSAVHGGARVPGRRLVTLSVGLVIAAPLALLGSTASAAPARAVPYDFNGDGRPDLVVGAPFLQVAAARAAGGVAVLLVSNEIEEVLGLAHRVLVMRAGRVVAELAGDDLTEAAVLSASFGRTASAA